MFLGKIHYCYLRLLSTYVASHSSRPSKVIKKQPGNTKSARSAVANPSASAATANVVRKDSTDSLASSVGLKNKINGAAKRHNGFNAGEMVAASSHDKPAKRDTKVKRSSRRMCFSFLLFFELVSHSLYGFRNCSST